MSLNDIMINNLIMSSLLKNNKEKLDYFLIAFIFIINYTYINSNIFKILTNYLKKNTKVKILFVATSKYSSARFRALMYYISENCNIKELKEPELCPFRYDDKICDYRVNQLELFKITNEIDGIITFTEKENKEKDKIVIDQLQSLEISSKVLTLKQLKEFIELCNDNYESTIKNSVRHQLYIDIYWDNKDKDIITKSNKWKSSTTFNNKFFTNKDYIIKKLKFFLENKELYITRGIPHTLGFLLYGDPGTGKSSFIKAIANETGYHIVNIKLSKNFDFHTLHKIIFNDKISNDLIIQFNKRIIIFEYINFISDIIKNRE